MEEKMQKTKIRKKSRLLACLLSVAILIGCMPANSQVVYGAENRVNTVFYGLQQSYMLPLCLR